MPPRRAHAAAQKARHTLTAWRPPFCSRARALPALAPQPSGRRTRHAGVCFSSRQSAKRKLTQYGPEDAVPNAPTSGPLPLRDAEDMGDFATVNEPESHAFALALAGAANDTKAVDISVLDVANVVSWTRYFVIATCFSRPQVDACVSRMTDAAEAEPFSRELGHTPGIGA
jgi:hypothetical protein